MAKHTCKILRYSQRKVFKSCVTFSLNIMHERFNVRRTLVEISVTQLEITCSKLIIETIEQGVLHRQS